METLSAKGEVIRIPSDEDLTRTYTEIEQVAIAGIREDKVIGNPVFEEGYRENRYSIASCGMLTGSQAGNFLTTAIDILTSVEPTVRFIPADFLHLTFGEIVFGTAGRRATHVNTQTLMEYYWAIRNNLPQNYDTMRLRLQRILPALDPPLPGTDQRSVSIVAGFTTNGDNGIFRLRQDIRDAVTDSSLKVTSRLGAIKVLFVTLGRLRQVPRVEDGQIPLLDAIDNLNRKLMPEHQTAFDYIQLLSTTPLSYPNTDKHAYIWPPIALNKDQQQLDQPRIITANQRRRRISTG